MKHWETIVVHAEQTLLKTMKIIDDASLQFAVVVNKENQLLGTVTDGDIRRSILRGEELNTSISNVMNKKPVFAYEFNTRNECLDILTKYNLKQLPIVNKEKQLVDIIFKELRNLQEGSNTVILMVGGLGARLRPLTDNIPKPMLKVGNKPILEIIIEGFKRYGYTNFILSVNYKKEMIQNYFQSGEAFGVNITYIEETKRMGTAGALSLLCEKPTKPVFVMNGDLLTQVNFDQLMQFHNEQEAVATMCVREYEYQIPYGVIKTESAKLVSIQEKPIHKSFVNAGIYVLNPEAFDYIPKDVFFDMPTLFETIIADNKVASIFPIREYWLDIGRMDDFEKAKLDYGESSV
ncbi:nucleotidyltransferase family protein [Lysinibacillus xylanilyticus]|uniref:nucleotidyltransferase family protein n=1 Tax=Lysinibacillus xylanilyticus TaxID=582475 RepID=UPI00083C9289|nr:nucleotidyltransferase family protein [Lysinibacillus xylanilyticus]